MSTGVRDAWDDLRHRDVAERGRLAEVDRPYVGDDQRRSPSHVEHAERRDEGRQAELGHHQAVQQSARRAGQDTDDDTDDDRQIPLVIAMAGHHGRQAHDRPDGEVDATGGDDERHPQSEDAVDRGREQDADDVVELEEVLRRKRERREQHDERAEREYPLDDVAADSQPSSRLRRLGLRRTYGRVLHGHEAIPSSVERSMTSARFVA
jgi:hypothetical protein